ncbi:MAG: efflux RND transporter permease subunit [Dehalococcoidia bacterium]
MLQRAVDATLSRKLMVLVLAGALIALGYSQLQAANVEALPEFSPVRVEVQTEALGLSAEEVEQLITVPMEADLLNGVAWVSDIHSRSISGLSSIVMTFEPGTDLFRARQMVQERMTQAHALPNVSRPPVMVNPLASESRVLNVGLSSKQVSLVDLSTVARWTVVPRLLGVPGVANVSIYGQRERQLQVQANPRKLADEQVTLQDLIATTGNALWVSPLSFLEASTPGSGGFVDTPNQRISVQHIPSISEAVDLEGVAMEGSSEATLGDVARVTEDHQPLIGDAVVAGGNGVLLVIDRYAWASSRDVTVGVERAFTELAGGLAGIDVDLNLYRASDYVARAETNTQRAALMGAALLALVTLALASNWRVGLIALATIAVSAAAAFAVIGYRDITLNAMVIGGLVLALGVIVDDAIGTAEAARQRVSSAGGRGGRSGRSARRARRRSRAVALCGDRRGAH